MRPVHYMLALLVVVLWGVNFIFIDFGLRDWPPLLLVAARFTFVVIPAIFFVKFPRGNFRRVLLIGVFMSAGQFGLLYTSMSLGLPAGLASIVIQIQAAFTVLVAALALREIPNRRQIVGILIGLSGLGVIGLSLQASVPIAAFLVALGASLSWAVGNVIARGVKEGTNGVQMTVWSALVVPVPLFALSLLVDGPAEVAHALTHPTWGVVASVVYTAGCASLIGYVIWNSLLARFPASQVAPFSLLVPLVGVLSAWLVLGDRPTVPELIGGALLLLGVAVTTGVLKTIGRSFTGRKRRSRKVVAG
ncbi:MAG: EamA family transporter, partial [Brevibacterium sp.]|nr:EamA family transporter [Brevibacterium sp.]